MRHFTTDQNRKRKKFYSACLADVLRDIQTAPVHDSRILPNGPWMKQRRAAVKKLKSKISEIDNQISNPPALPNQESNDV